MAEHDRHRHVEISNGGRAVAAAEVTTSPGPDRTARASLRAESGHITPGSRASLVDAVLDLPEVQDCARLEAACPLGDSESLHRLEQRCADVSTHPGRGECARGSDPPSRPCPQHRAGASPATTRSVMTAAVPGTATRAAVTAITRSESAAAAGPPRRPSDWHVTLRHEP